MRQRNVDEFTANWAGRAAERDKLESDYARQTSQLANDLDDAKAAADDNCDLAEFTTLQQTLVVKGALS